LLICLYACMEGKKKTYVNDQGQQVSEIFYRNGILKSRFIYKDDSKRNYLYTTYFSDGMLHDSALYLRDTVKGLRKVYDRKNSLMHYETYKNGIVDPVSKEGNLRVFRGGSYLQNQKYCRSADRNAFGSNERRTYIGFRVIKIK